MNQPSRRYLHVYAIIRIDTFHSLDVALEDRITIVKALWHRDDAEREVQRLNALNAAKGANYFLRTARLERPAAD